MLDLKNIAMDILQQAMNEVSGEALISSKIILNNDVLQINEKKINLSQFKRIFVIGAGKASASMARGLEAKIGEFITEGVVIVKDNHYIKCKRIKILEGAHPVIDERAFKNSGEVLRICEKANKNDLIICLISGGGSALLEKLPKEISLKDVQTLTEVLLKSGAGIQEVNTVRKKISFVKGGGLARAAFPATLISLIISDVIGDRIDIISSGPTARDYSTFKAALAVLEKYEIGNKVPKPVFDYLTNSQERKADLEKGKKVFEKVSNIVLGSNKAALIKAKKVAEGYGFDTEIIGEDFAGSIKELADLFFDKIKYELCKKDRKKQIKCFLAGGEPVLKVEGFGKGGRNQHLVLEVLQKLKVAHREFFFCSIGTDGTDGPTDAAGAFINYNTLTIVEQKKLNIENYLKNCDSYNFFKQAESLIKTGPSGTNVMDIAITLV